MKDVSERMGVFENGNGKLYFVYDISSLREGKYRLAGQFVRWSLIHGGPGLGALSPNVFSLATGCKNDLQIEEIEDICDPTTRDNLKKVNINLNWNEKKEIKNAT